MRITVPLSTSWSCNLSGTKCATLPLLFRHQPHSVFPCGIKLSIDSKICVIKKEKFISRLNSENDDISLKDVWSPALHYFSGYAFSEVEESVKTLATVVVKGHTSTLKVKHHRSATVWNQKNLKFASISDCEKQVRL